MLQSKNSCQGGDHLPCFMPKKMFHQPSEKIKAWVVPSLEHGGVSGWLEELYVLPQWRGRGIGSRLVGEVIAHARELGYFDLPLYQHCG
jgi:GNAT superfamily N-acetyltransferase